MRNSRRSFVTALMILGSLMLFGGSLVINERVGAQNPTPKETRDCKWITNEIKGLYEQIHKLEVDIKETEANVSSWNEKIEKIKAQMKEMASNPFSTEEDRGLFLDNIRALASFRRADIQFIDRLRDQIQSINRQIADLLDFVGDHCVSKTATPPAPQTPTTPQPPSPPGPFRPPLPNSIATTPSQPFSLPGFHIDTNTANGLYVTTFTTPQGKIKVNLTDDVAAGDTISGTVETEPAGKDEKERAQNQAELNGYVIELEGQKTNVGDKKITCNIPSVLTPEAKTIVLQHNGQTVATTEIPISATAPPAPPQFTLPTGGQQGKPIYIKGPCDGAFSPQDHIKVGPTILPPVAESPRSLVVLDLSDVVGPTNIDCNENGVAMQCPFHNIRVNLSALRLNLQRGETTTLHVQVLGLGGITEDEWLDLEDTSPTVIKMSGGEIQHIIIPRAQVQKDGTYSTDRTLTGIMAGGFGVTGTVKWSDVCTHPATH